MDLLDDGNTDQRDLMSLAELVKQLSNQEKRMSTTRCSSLSVRSPAPRILRDDLSLSIWSLSSKLVKNTICILQC